MSVLYICVVLAIVGGAMAPYNNQEKFIEEWFRTSSTTTPAPPATIPKQTPCKMVAADVLGSSEMMCEAALIELKEEEMTLGQTREQERQGRILYKKSQ